MDIRKLERKTIAGMKPYESSIVAEAECKMDQNESPYDVPKGLKGRILRRLMKTPFNRYPDLSYLRLRKIIARKFGVEAEQVAVGSGVDDLLYCVSLAYLEEGDKVAYFTPTFGMYRICCSIMGAAGVEVPLEADFSLPDSFVKKCGDAKLVILCRPNSPTGNSVPLAQVGKIVRACRGLVCIDEAYADFADDDCAGFLKYGNVLIFRTLSKAYSAAGARVGFAIADRRVIDAINKVRLPWNLSTFSQVAGEELLADGGFAKGLAKKIRSERKRLTASLRLMGARPVESEANFILFRVPDAEMAFRKMLAEGVLVRKYSSPALKNCLRVTVGTGKENGAFLRSLLKASADLVLFDIDGTLVDVSNSYIQAIRLTAEEISGKRVAMALVRKVKAMEGMNNDWDATVEVLRRMGVKSSRGRVVPIFQAIYFGKNEDGLMRTEKPLVDSRLIAKIGKRVGIVTGRSREEAKVAMGMLGLPKNTLLVAMEDCRREKPDPAPLFLAKKLGGSSFPIYIGDSASDRRAAQRAGMGFVAIGKGSAKDGEFARFGNANDAIRRLFL